MAHVTHDDETEREVLMRRALSAAMDEIWRLRRAIAYEAEVVVAHTGYRTFPKTRRAIAEEQVERMRKAARGNSQLAYAGTSSISLRQALPRIGAPQTYTLGDFIHEQGLEDWR